MALPIMTLPDPVVRMRELRKNGVNFVLENVDLSCVVSYPEPTACTTKRVVQFRKLVETGHDG